METWLVGLLGSTLLCRTELPWADQPVDNILIKKIKGTTPVKQGENMLSKDNIKLSNLASHMLQFQKSSKLSTPWSNMFFFKNFSPHPGKDLVISVGGFRFTDISPVMVYNVQEGTWLQANNFPIAFRSGQAFVLGKSLLYVTGGYSDPDSFMIRQYNYENDTWKDVFQLPDSKKNGISLVYNTDQLVWCPHIVVKILKIVQNKITFKQELFLLGMTFEILPGLSSWC